MSLTQRSVRRGHHGPRVTNEPLRPTSICLACGEALAPPLERSASLRCHDCRDAAVPIRPELVPDAARSTREDRVLRAA